MSAEYYFNLTDNFTSIYNFSSSFSYESSLSSVCTFQEIYNLSELINLFKNQACYRHSFGFTLFLCIANVLILVFGLVGNSLVIYVVSCRIKTRTASTIFILNLAVADLLVILCCIPATLMANLFTPWVLGDIMCKIVPYGQGVSVFCSVFSLVAISFDRFRAIHHTMSLTRNITSTQATKIVLVIWFLGLTITLPWAFVFKVKTFTSFKADASGNFFLPPKLPFCNEIWESKILEVAYFLLIHVFACFILPLCLITVCNVVIWRNVLRDENSYTNSQSISNNNSLGQLQRQRKLRVLKMFTGLTFLFFMCWLPLYVIMARVKLFYTENFTGNKLEHQLIPVLIPVAQLLGSCNSCVNPVLYALLNRKLRQICRVMFSCPTCKIYTTKHDAGSGTREEIEINSIAMGVPAKIPLGEEEGRIANSTV